jgi:hypothetical protein
LKFLAAGGTPTQPLNLRETLEVGVIKVSLGRKIQGGVALESEAPLVYY